MLEFINERWEIIMPAIAFVLWHSIHKLIETKTSKLVPDDIIAVTEGENEDAEIQLAPNPNNSLKKKVVFKEVGKTNFIEGSSNKRRYNVMPGNKGSIPIGKIKTDKLPSSFKPARDTYEKVDGAIKIKPRLNGQEKTLNELELLSIVLKNGIKGNYHAKKKLEKQISLLLYIHSKQYGKDFSTSGNIYKFHYERFEKSLKDKKHIEIKDISKELEGDASYICKNFGSKDMESLIAALDDVGICHVPIKNGNIRVEGKRFMKVHGGIWC